MNSDKDFTLPSVDVRFVEQQQPSPDAIVLNGRYYTLEGDAAQIARFKDVFGKTITGLTTIAEVTKEFQQIVVEEQRSKVYAVGARLLGKADSNQEELEHVQVLQGVRPTICLPGAPRIVSIQDRMKDLGIHGVGIAVLNKGTITCEGFGDLQDQTKLVQAASISKTVTALTILSLVDQGILDLSDDVSQIIGPDLWKSIDPDKICEKTGSKMTIRHLLSHTAGLKEDKPEGFAGYSSDTKMLPTLDAIIKGEGVNSDPARVDSKPGDHYAYTGGAAMILQKVIELKTNTTFEKAAGAHVFSKFGLKDSFFSLPDKSRAVHGEGSDCKPLPGGWVLQPELAAAGLWTTPHDLAKIALGIQKSLSGKEGGLISKDRAKEMLTPQMQADRNPGLGVFVEQVKQTTYFYHDGSNLGFRSVMVANDKEQAAVVMVNSERGNDIIPELIRSIAEEYNWQEREGLSLDFPPVPPELLEANKASVQIESLKLWGEKYQGQYQFDNELVTVTVLGDEIFLNSGDASYQLVPIAGTVGCFRKNDPGPWTSVIFRESKDGVTSFALDRRPRVNQKQWMNQYLHKEYSFGRLFEERGKVYAQIDKREPIEIWPTPQGFRDANPNQPPVELYTFTKDPKGVIGIVRIE
ncbi:MAG: beta-lactamase family protein [Chlamydiales bacterium]|nr:beta-lactamase family protein [Chlamydiales bacterium]